MKPQNSQLDKIWAEGQQVGNIDGSRVMELLQERWIPVFGRMHYNCEQILKELGSTRKCTKGLSDMQIVLDLHPGKASWKASVTEKYHSNCERRESRWRGLI